MESLHGLRKGRNDGLIEMSERKLKLETTAYLCKSSFTSCLTSSFSSSTPLLPKYLLYYLQLDGPSDTQEDLNRSRGHRRHSSLQAECHESQLQRTEFANIPRGIIADMKDILQVYRQESPKCNGFSRKFRQLWMILKWMTISWSHTNWVRVKCRV